MVAPMARAAVLMTPTPPLGRKDLINGTEQVVIAPRPDLDHGDTGRGVRNEHREQPIVAGGGEPRHVRCDVYDAGTAPGVDHDLFADHPGRIRPSARSLRRLIEPSGHLFVDVGHLANLQVMDPVPGRGMGDLLETGRMIVSTECDG